MNELEQAQKEIAELTAALKDMVEAITNITAEHWTNGTRIDIARETLTKHKELIERLR